MTLSRPFAFCALLLFAAATLPAQQPASLPFLSATPLEIKSAKTVGGQSLSLKSLVLGLQPMADGSPGIVFSSTPPVKLDEIGSLHFAPRAQDFVGSHPAKVEAIYLGGVGFNAPLTPNWAVLNTRAMPWEPARDSTATAIHLHDAQPVWGTNSKETDPGEYLLAQTFKLDDAQSLGRATLRITARADIRELRLNDQPVHLADGRSLEFAEFEVTELLPKGDNRLAMHVSSLRDGDSRPSVAWHIELVSFPGLDRGDTSLPGFGIIMAQGIARSERAWGSVSELDAAGVTVQTDYGPWRLRSQDLKSMLFPRGFAIGVTKDGPIKSRIKDVLGSPKPEPGPATGLPISWQPDPVESLTLLNHTGAMPAMPDHLQNGLAKWDGRSERLERIVALYPKTNEQTELIQPSQTARSLFAEIETPRGEVFRGVLQAINDRRIELQTDEQRTLQFKPDQVAIIRFPYHNPSSDIVTKIGIVPNAPGLEEFQSARERVALQLQHAAFMSNAQVQSIDQAALTSADALSELHAIAILDPAGEYIDTLNETGDVRNALSTYIRGGGTLLLYSDGGALRTQVSGKGGRFVRTVRAENLLADLGLNLSSVKKPILPTRPFEDAASASAPRLERADAQLSINAGFVGDAPIVLANKPVFHPIIMTPPGQSAIVELRNDKGQKLGPALSIFDVGDGHVIVIDHLLWDAEIAGVPFVESGLTGLLNSLHELRN